MKFLTIKKRHQAHTQRSTAGFSLVEVVVGISITALLLIGTVLVMRFYIQVGSQNADKIQALYLVEEALEVVRFMRDEDWDTNLAPLVTETDYHLYFDGSDWLSDLVLAPIHGQFTRRVVFSDVYRLDSDEDIVPQTDPGAKYLDTDTKLVTVSVSWERGTSDVVGSMYIANTFK